MYVLFTTDCTIQTKNFFTDAHNISAKTVLFHFSSLLTCLTTIVGFWTQDGLIFLFFLRVRWHRTNFRTASLQSEIFGFDFDFYQQSDAGIGPVTAGINMARATTELYTLPTQVGGLPNVSLSRNTRSNYGWWLRHCRGLSDVIMLSVKWCKKIFSWVFSSNRTKIWARVR